MTSFDPAAVTTDEELWQVLTSTPADDELPVVYATVVSATRDVAIARHDEHGSIMIPASETGRRRLRAGDHVAGHLTGARTAGASVLTCSRPSLVTDLMAGVVPEVRDGQVRVMGVARVPGVRSKVAVAATAPGIDPVSITVGKRANRVQALSALLGGERIDVVGWDPDPLVWLRRALAPAEVGEIRQVGEVTYVEAAAHLMSAAVGAGGLNSALAGRLAGCRVQVVLPGGIPTP